MNSSIAVAQGRRTATMDAHGIGQAIARMALGVAAAYARARTRRILSSLDDAALKDIGLVRGQIDAAERDPRYTPRFPGF